MMNLSEANEYLLVAHNVVAQKQEQEPTTICDNPVEWDDVTLLAAQLFGDFISAQLRALSHVQSAVAVDDGKRDADDAQCDVEYEKGTRVPYSQPQWHEQMNRQRQKDTDYYGRWHAEQARKQAERIRHTVFP
jgi:hypothetical protein